VTRVAIIGGSGLTNLKNLDVTRSDVVGTPYGEPSGPMVYGRLSGKDVVFLPRHGPDHSIPPHRVNYRANMWALKQVGVKRIVAVAAVGGIADNLQARDLVFPDQIIDYTYGRSHTFFDGEDGKVTHVDFTFPYCSDLRRRLAEAARRAGIAAVEKGTYGATQGPRFETAAEIRRMERDGADIVGMTGMPEAALARELDIRYAAIAVVVNRAAGKEESIISLKEIEAHLEAGMVKVRTLLESAIPAIAGD
jgi:5'-methylthioinosine phosphorylase